MELSTKEFLELRDGNIKVEPAFKKHDIDYWERQSKRELALWCILFGFSIALALFFGAIIFAWIISMFIG